MYLKKFFWTLSLTSLLNFGWGTVAFAQGEPPATCHGLPECVELIYLTSLQILKSVNRLPEFIEAWIGEDNNKDSFTPKLQENFAQYIDNMLTNEESQKNDQKLFMKDFFAGVVPSYVNQVSFTTLLGSPYSTKPEKDADGKTVDSVYQYLKNASGINIGHIAPSNSWRGSADAKLRYQEYYKTISAVQSFNTYMLSSFYEDAKNNLNLSKKQKELLIQATDSDWFVEVASENIGVVLRQLLLFNSQMYVILLKNLETSKQQVAAQSITNTLLILGNQYTEKTLYSNATGNSSSSAATSL